MTVSRTSDTIPVALNNSTSNGPKGATRSSETTPLLAADLERQDSMRSLHSRDSVRTSHSRDSSHSWQSIQSGLPLYMIDPLPDMQIRCHRIGKDGGISICEQETALTGSKQGTNHFWIDIDANPHHARELRQWLQKLNLPAFVVDVLSEPPDLWASQVIPLRRASLAVVRTLPEREDSDEMTHLAALKMNNLIITFTSCERTQVGNLYSPVLARMKEPERLPAPTSTGAFFAWMRFHLDRTSQATHHLRHTVLAMDASMDRNISSVKMMEIIEAKDQLLRLLSVSEEQHACLQSMEAFERGKNESSTLKASLSILLATAEATERMTVRLEKQIADLRQRLEDHEHRSMNRRLAVLTVLSAVFLPLTLFTGIWGMNFENMPELSKPYAYPMALSFMIFVACVMIGYFRRSGWLDEERD